MLPINLRIVSETFFIVKVFDAVLPMVTVPKLRNVPNPPPVVTEILGKVSGTVPVPLKEYRAGFLSDVVVSAL